MGIILGIDPGSHVTGWGLIAIAPDLRYVSAGCLQARKTLDEADRMLSLFQQLQEVIGRYTPTQAAIERPYVNANAQSSLTLGAMFGVCMLAAAQSGIPVTQYPPSTIKHAVSGHGHSAKESVAACVRLILNISEVAPCADATDALAVAITHGQIVSSLSNLKTYS